jgi:AcrR family transcriptional regulator
MSNEKSLIKASAERRAAGGRLRAKPEQRKAALDAVLVQVLRSEGIAGVTLANIATRAECSTGTVGAYYKGADAMRLAAVNILAATDGDCKALRRVFEDGYNIKTKGLKLPKGFKL